MTFVLKLWNGQWLYAFGIILSFLGVLYTGCSFLNYKKYVFLKTITEGQTVGIIVAIFFTLSSVISVVTGNLINSLLVVVLHDNIALPPPDFSENFSIMIPGGLIMGAILGVLYWLLKKGEEKQEKLAENKEEQREKQAGNEEQSEDEEEKLKSIFARHLWLFGAIGFVLMLGSSIGIVAWTLSPAPFLPHRDIYSIILFSAGNIGGCLSGAVISAARKSSWKNVWRCFIVFVLLFLLFIFLMLLGNSSFQNVLDGILHYSLLGMVVGISISSKPRPGPKRGAVENFIFWLGFGGILVPLLCFVPLLYFGFFTVTDTDAPFLYFTLYYFLLLGIVNSQGDQILRRIELKHHQKEDRDYASISWKRFAVGLIIGMLDISPAVLFLLAMDVLLGKASGIIVYDLSQNINFALLVGLCIGFIHGVGPWIISWIDNLEDRQLGQLGIFITEAGLIISILPH